MQIIGGAVLFGSGATVTKQIVIPPGIQSGDPALAIGNTVSWSSNTFFYTAGYDKLSGSDIQYDTNNMVWQLFYAHKSVRIPIGSQKWGPISRLSGSNSQELRAIVAANNNDKTNWGPNVETQLYYSGGVVPYTANTLFQQSTTTAITIPANRYFLLGIYGGPFYRNYKRTANNITAVNAGNAVVTVLNEVYVGSWPTGPTSGVPTQLGGNTSNYLKFTSNLYYSAFKFEIKEPDVLVYDFDAANYSSMPVNNSTVSSYPLTVMNSGNSIVWSSENGGVFKKLNSTGTDFIYGGPNYVTANNYTVFTAYALTSNSSGRLLNTQSELVKDWMMGGYTGRPNAFYPNFTVNLNGSSADTVWHLNWATWDSSTNTGKLYQSSSSTPPSNYTYTATNAAGGGFNQIRLFSRSANSEVQSGSIAFVKVYNGALELSDIQALHAQYKSRFGY